MCAPCVDVPVSIKRMHVRDAGDGTLALACLRQSGVLPVLMGEFPERAYSDFHSEPMWMLAWMREMFDQDLRAKDPLFDLFGLASERWYAM